MQEITVGLAPRKTSFFDPLTNAYITLAKPTQQISFDETKPDVLANIAHALLCKSPALVLYEGTLPAESISAWEEKFKKLFNSSLKPARRHDGVIAAATQGAQALDRAEQIKAGDAEFPNAQALEEATLFDLGDVPPQAEDPADNAAEATVKNKRNSAKTVKE